MQLHRKVLQEVSALGLMPLMTNQEGLAPVNKQSVLTTLFFSFPYHYYYWEITLKSYQGIFIERF